MTPRASIFIAAFCLIFTFGCDSDEASNNTIGADSAVDMDAEMGGGDAISGESGGSVDEVPSDAAGPADDDEGDVDRWWEFDVDENAEPPSEMDPGDNDGKGDGTDLSMQECIDACTAKGQSSRAECEAACVDFVGGSGGGDKDNAGQGTGGDGKDDESLPGGDDDGKDDGALPGGEDDGSGDAGAGDDGTRDGTPCADGFDPSTPCQGDALSTACVFNGEWYWCEGGAWSSGK